MKKEQSIKNVLPLPAGRLSASAPLLLKWYGEHRRAFPWREEATPYRIWISEIMLQQTRIEAALPYFDRFLTALPTVKALAKVEEGRLLKLWEGLGYYNRARNLQKAAKIIMRDYAGELPASYEQLLKLPGVGEYTAGAIASTAFGIPVPAVDGNVLRVTARLLDFHGDVASPPVRGALRQAVCSMLPDGTPGEFNQAIMELGETVCLPNAVPLCGQCPLAGDCRGLAAGHPEELPVRAAKKERRVEQRTVLVILAEGRVLLHRRAPRGLLAGMWELPNGDGWLTAAEAADFVGQKYSPQDATTAEPLGKGKHVFSHVEWRMQGYKFRAAAFEAPEDCAWADLAQLRDDYALPSAFRTYARHLPEWLKDQGRTGNH